MKKPKKTETGTAVGGSGAPAQGAKRGFKVDKSVGADQPRGGYKPAKSARPGTAPPGRGGASAGGNGGGNGTGTADTSGSTGNQS
ncbi:hypothetical protein ACFCXC_12605 [Streptomyces microflavus]|uniref:Uncharacterized protein n=1 Tax=Streptomyces microflavus TaxID=1919 RepID=A0A7H8MMV3_STRMI|nr:hypothetical protein [Streptomyces microflavus]QKW43114.1 hypothetical protein HUT09_11405 [Streptomyces microflavus]